MIYFVVFVWFGDAIFVSVAIFKPFLNQGCCLKFGFFSYTFSISVIVSAKPLSEFGMLFLCDVFLRCDVTYCKFKLSVSSSFIMISACSNLLTSLP